MPDLDFGPSSEGSEAEAWESNANKLSKQKEEKEQAEKRHQKEEEAARNREKLRKRTRENFTGDVPELSETAKQRLDEKRRCEQNIIAASNMLQDDSSDGEKASGAVKKKAATLRDYTIEDEFMGGDDGAVVGTTQGSKSIEQMEPKTIEQFDAFADAIVTKLVSTYQNDNDVLYMHCLKRIVEGALSPLYHEDAKELSDVCARISAEMYRKEAEKKKKKGKAQKGGSRQRVSRSLTLAAAAPSIKRWTTTTMTSYERSCIH